MSENEARAFECDLGFKDKGRSWWLDPTPDISARESLLLSVFVARMLHQDLTRRTAWRYGSVLAWVERNDLLRHFRPAEETPPG